MRSQLYSLHLKNKKRHITSCFMSSLAENFEIKMIEKNLFHERQYYFPLCTAYWILSLPAHITAGILCIRPLLTERGIFFLDQDFYLRATGAPVLSHTGFLYLLCARGIFFTFPMITLKFLELLHISSVIFNVIMATEPPVWNSTT